MVSQVRVVSLIVVSLFFSSLVGAQSPASPILDSFPVHDESIGALGGGHRVGQDGAASYSIPIRMLPGRAGIIPEVAIVYSSMSGNDILGQGWSITGLSAVSRCGANLSRDGLIDPVDFDSNDNFCLDSQRLVVVDDMSANPLTGEAAVEYRLENENYSQIFGVGQIGSGHEYFFVRTRDGKYIYFGDRDDSRIEANGHNAGEVSTWAISRVQDRYSNYMEYRYIENTQAGDYYIDYIDYTGNESAGIAPSNRIQFEYSSRQDTYKTYYAGSHLRRTVKLDHIVVESAGVAVTEYNFSYTTGPIGDHAHWPIVLESIEQCNSGICLPETQIAWRAGHHGSGFNAPGSSTEWVGHNGDMQNNTIADLNNDGKADIAGYLDNALWDVRLSSGTNFAGGAPWIGHMGGTSNGVMGDFNGDGLADSAGHGGNGVWDIRMSTGSGFESQSGLWAGGPPANGADTIGGDFNGDGLADLASYTAGGWWYVALSTGSGFAPGAEGLLWAGPAVSASAAISGDFNGDGRTDLAAYSPVENQWLVSLSTGSNFESSWWGGPGGAGPDDVVVGDFNGDGLSDLAAYVIGSATDQWHIAFSNGRSFANGGFWAGGPQADGVKVYAADVNADGLTDLVASGQNLLWHVARSTGKSFRSSTWIGPGGMSDGSRPADIDGDGATDLIAKTNLPFRWHVALSNANAALLVERITGGMGTWVEFSYKQLTDASVYRKGSNTPYPLRDIQTAMYVVDRVRASNGIGGHITSSHSYAGMRAHPQGIGLLGFESTVTVNDDTGIATKTVYSHESDLALQGAVLTIETVANDRNAANYDPSLAHTDWAAWQASGHRTSLTTNSWQAKVEMSGVSQRLSLGGNSSLASVSKADCLASYTEAQCDSRRYHRVLINTEIEKYDLNGAFLNRELNFYGYSDFDNPKFLYTMLYDESGAMIRQKAVFNDYYPADFSAWIIEPVQSTFTLVSNGQYSSRKVGFEYDPQTGIKTKELVYDTGNAVNNSTSFPVVLETRSEAIDVFGNVTRTVVVGSDIAQRQSTVSYDPTGRYVISAENALNHVVSTSYFPDGHVNVGLKATTTDANNIVTEYEYDLFGRGIRSTSALNTAKEVNSYTSMQRCDAITDSAPCNVTADSQPIFRTSSYTDGGAVAHVYIDVLGREVHRSAQVADGRYSHISNGYDGLGRNIRVSQPYFSGDLQHNTFIEYDALARAISTTAPNGIVDTIDYNGLQRISRNDVNGLNQSKTVYRNPMGDIVQVLDNNNAEVQYRYDATSNMIEMIDDAGNTTIISYDSLGRKISMDDPDKGLWTYTYDVLGQLITQTNARGETSCSAYDVLGRVVKRVDNYLGQTAQSVGESVDATNDCANSGSDENSYWVYDSSPGGASIGKLYYAWGYNSYLTANLYDAFGNAVTRYEIIDGKNYVTNVSYDNFHRVDVTTYPGENANERLEVRNGYNALGFTVQLLDPADGSKVYYELLDVDASGNVIQELYGNGVETFRTFEPETNRIDTIRSFNVLDSAEPSIQNIDFDFDALGNIDERNDYIQNIYETFQYDQLNRLEYAYADFGNGEIQTTAVTYDALGNIQSKTGVGTYQYGGTCNGQVAGPHAVTSITSPKSATYCYDANGNMTSGDGRSIAYTSFDKPYLITKGDYSTEILYNHDRSRYKRIDLSAEGQTTYIYAASGLYEHVTKADGDTEERHYIGGNIIVTIENRSSSTTGTTLERYLHKDHIGSTTVITNDLGIVVEQFSFDPWGKRRAPNLAELEAELGDWASLSNYEKANLTISAIDLSSGITNRGFTGHEQLDGVGLIHMNGRVYDAEIGRFISADPIIQDRTSLQNLNRYTYVNNNPLSYTDPSGYIAKKLGRMLKKVVKALYNTTVGILVNAYQWAWSNVYKPALIAIGQVEGLSSVISIALNFIPGCQGWCSMVFNAALSSAHGAAIGDILAGAAIGFVTSGIPGGGGFLESGLAGGLRDMALAAGISKTAAVAVGGMIAGGIAAKAQGGKFIDGVKGAAIGMAVNAIADKISGAFKMGEKTADNGAPNAERGCNPINFATGEKYLMLSDIAVVGNSRLHFTRYYGSYDKHTTALGHRWRHNFDRKLKFEGESAEPVSVTSVREKGDAIIFSHFIEEGYRTESNEGYVLTQLPKPLTSIAEKSSDGATWRLSTPDNVIEYYDHSGALLRVEYLGGYTQYFDYETTTQSANDAGQRLVEVRDTLGYALHFGYSASGRLVSVVDKAQKIIRFMHDGRGNLVSSATNISAGEDKKWAKVSYLYDDDRFPHAITGIVDENGERVHYMAYDNQGRAISSALGGNAERDQVVFHGRTEGGAYSSTVTNTLGRTTTYTFDKHNNPVSVLGDSTENCIASNKAYVYDWQGRLSSETNWSGVETQYEYNDRGLEISRIEAVGTDVERRILTRWHDSLRLPVEIVEPGKTTRLTYNEKGLLEKRQEIDTLAERSMLAKLFAQFPTRSWRYEYNEQGLIATVDGPLAGDADTTTYAYNAEGQRTHVSNALGHTARTLAFNSQGLPTVVEDANHVKTFLHYNQRGWLVEKSVETNDGLSTTSYTYTGARLYNGGGSPQANQGLVDSITLPNGMILRYDYDAAGRVVAMRNANGEELRYQYDKAGNRTLETVLSASGDVIREQRYVYDELSRLLRSVGAAIDGERSTTQFVYDASGNRIEQIDPMGRSTQFAYDALNRLVKTTDAADGHIYQQWDAQDQLIAVTDQRGLTTRYTYNGFGDKIAQYSPDTGVTRFKHDRSGNVVEKTDARGVSTKYRYDVLGRLTDVTYHDDSQNVHYSYDSANDADYGVGRLLSVRDAAGETQYRYNALGKVVEETKLMSGQKYQTNYSYDLAGNVVETVYPSGQAVVYHYDKLGRVQEMLSQQQRASSSEMNSRSIVSNLGYDAFGGINRVNYGNGSSLAVSRDKRGRIDQIQLRSAVNDDMYHKVYTYDLASNVVAITDAVLPKASQWFSYDSLSRLTEAQGHYGQLGFVYDSVGNRIQKIERATNDGAQPKQQSQDIVEQYRYAETSNRLLSVDQRRLDYDANGNIIADTASVEGKRLSYGANNRLASVQTDDGYIEYVYNAKGQRVIRRTAKSGETSERHYHYNLANQLIAETDADGELIKDYMYVGNERFAVLDYSVASCDLQLPDCDGELLFIHNDHLGTPQLMTDIYQSVVWQVDRKPFGEIDTRVAALDLAAGFPGQYADDGSGYIYNYFRDYDPSLGRYIQSDPIGLVAGPNTYAYVSGNPLAFFDPLGLQTCPVSGENYVPDNQLNTSSRDVLWGNRSLDEQGQVVLSLPENWEAVPLPKGGGFVVGPPGYEIPADGVLRSVVRVQPPGTGSIDYNPGGYYVVHNSQGQRISPYSGRTISTAQSHNPIGRVNPGRVRTDND